MDILDLTIIVIGCITLSVRLSAFFALVLTQAISLAYIKLSTLTEKYGKEKTSKCKRRPNQETRSRTGCQPKMGVQVTLQSIKKIIDGEGLQPDETVGIISEGYLLERAE